MHEGPQARGVTASRRRPIHLLRGSPFTSRRNQDPGTTSMRRDVRRCGGRQPTDVATFVGLIEERIRALDREPVELADAADRVLADDVVAPCAVPGFDRAAMDGYAVRGGETLGADPATPRTFAIAGVAAPGRPFAGMVEAGQAVRITTGAPFPA